MSNERPGIDHLKVGDEVVILWPRYRGHPERSTGVIVSQKRIWWEVEYKGRTNYNPIRVRKDSQKENNGAHAIRFATLEQLAWEDRRTAAAEYLRSIRVEYWNSPRFRDDALTLANLIRRHDGEEEF